MSFTYDCTCETCGTKVGEATFPRPLSDDERLQRCERGMLCEVCAAAAQAATVGADTGTTQAPPTGNG